MSAEKGNIGALASGLRRSLEGLKDGSAHARFHYINKDLVSNGIFPEKAFHHHGKKTEIYASKSPHMLVILRIPEAGILSNFFGNSRLIEVYASGDYERIDRGISFFPEQHIGLERLGALDTSRAQGAEVAGIIEKIEKKMEAVPKNSFVFDLHTHCKYGESITSGGYMSPEDLVKYAWFRTGLDGIALVPHYTKKGDPSYIGLVKAERALKDMEARLGIGERQFIMLKGLEYCVENYKHIIAILPEEAELGKLTVHDVNWALDDAVNFIHDHGGLAIAAHPYLKGSGIGENAIIETEAWRKVGVKWVYTTALDGIETKNGALIEMCPKMLKSMLPNLKCMNAMAEKLGQEIKKKNPALALTGGSDSHVTWHIGICTTRIEAKEFTYDSIFKAIQKGNTTPYGNYMNYLNYPKRMIVGGFAGQLRKIMGES